MPTQTPTLEDYAESLIKGKQYKTLTQEMHDELKKDIIARVHDFLLAKTIAKLSDEQAKALSELVDTNPGDQAIQEFIAKSIPGTSDFVGDTLFEFRQIYLGLA
jgi:hypothetical protein